jgi:LPXTG-site transpeptidase (sortase) family protein
VWDALPLGTESVIEFQAQFASLPGGAQVVNVATLIWSSLPGDQTAPSSTSNQRSVERVYNPDVLDWFGGVSDDAVFSTARLPATGFPAGVVTDISAQPDWLTYTAYDGLHLEIDKLGVNASIIGIPLQNGDWDLTWLWNQVGYLDGTAYPTWSGNTAITAHVYLPNGEPGPFVDLNTMVWGDEIIINSGGLEYVYQVRTVQRVWPDDVSVLRHEVYPWLTLITCQGFNEQTDEYLFRTAVRAVLVAVR